MQIGSIVDYCIDYNERNRQPEDSKEKPAKRKATQADINAFFG